MVDERRVTRLLRRRTNELAYLRSAAVGERAPLLEDPHLSALKYRFVTAIEGVVDVAQHICASEGWGPPADNFDAVRELARHGLLTTDLAVRVVSAVGLRNLLVHRYHDVDDRRVVAHLDGLADLDGYVDAVARWLARQGTA